MTPDDKRRLAGFYMIRMTPGSEIEPAQWSQVMGCWLTCGSEERISDHLVHEVVCNLDQATAERDAAALKWGEAMDRWEEALNKIATLTAERDAAMAALRPFAIAADDLDEKTRDNSEIWETPAAMGIEARDLRNAKAVLAAHSAATKPTEEVSG